MDLLIVILIASLYWIIGCLIVGAAKSHERAMNITILLLWPMFIVSLIVYGVVGIILKLGKGGNKSE